MKRRPTPKRHVLQSRPPMERMLRIHQAILSGKYPNATGLGRELEVSTKSIQRDIEFMRDRLRLPIAYDGAKWGYYYTEKVANFPTLQMTEGEMFALLVAEKALQQYRGTTFEEPLVSAFNKMAAALPDTISLSLANWSDTISFRTRAEPILDLKVFEALSRAAAQRQQLKLAYRKPGRRETEERIVDPYHLANINGEWFLFAWCHLRRDIRTFAPARIQAVETTGGTFTRPQKFSLEKRLRDSFGVQSGQEKHEVVIRFGELVSDYIREKKWHESQRLKELDDGGVELSMTLSGLAEVERWVLSWGGNAMALQPGELVERVRTSAERILRGG